MFVKSEFLRLSKVTGGSKSFRFEYYFFGCL